MADGNSVSSQPLVHLVERPPHIRNKVGLVDRRRELLEASNNQRAGSCAGIATSDPVSDGPKTNFTASENGIFVDLSNEPNVSRRKIRMRQPSG